MIEMDMGIKYNSKLSEVHETIKKLEELSFNLEKVKVRVDNIDSQLKNRIKEIYASYVSSSENVFFNDKLVMVYSQAISELEKINDSLKNEYSNYYKLYVLSKKLVDKINNVDENNIDVVVASALLILKLLKASSTIDYEIEEKIVNNIYKIVYDVLKLEAIYSRSSKLLEMIKLSDIDSQYIVKLIKEDISLVDNSEIKKAITNIEVVDLDDKYLLDKSLISLIALSNNSKFKNKIVDILLKNYSLYEELLNKLDSEEKDGKRISSFKETAIDNRRDSRRKANKQKIVLVINGIVVSAVLLGGSFAIKHFAKLNKYKTTVTTYDSYEDTFTVDESYKTGKKGSIKITEYSPWDNPGYFRDSYTRNVYTYNGLDELASDYSDISKYLNTNIKDNITYDTKSESVKSIPDDYGYSENKYIIVEVKKDLEDYIVEELEFPLLLALYAVLYLGVFCIDYNSILPVIRRLKQMLKEIKRINTDLERYKNELSKNKNSIDDLKKQIEEIKQLIINEYEKLPDILKENNELEEVKKLVLAK